MNRLFERLYLDRYLNIYIIFAMDMVVSAISSVLVLFAFSLVFPPYAAPGMRCALLWVLSGVFGVGLGFYMLKTYHSVIRHSNLREIGRLVLAVLVKEAVVCAVALAFSGSCISDPYLWLLLSCDGLLTAALLVLVRVCMVFAYDAVRIRMQRTRDRETVLIYGTDNKAISFVRTMELSDKYNVVGFIAYGHEGHSHMIHDRRVFTFDSEAEFMRIAGQNSLDSVIFAHRHDARQEEGRLIRYCNNARIRVLYSPSVEEVVGGKVGPGAFREIRIEDLLGRPEIRISLDEIRSDFRGSTVMVTGAAGSIGSELCRQLASFGVGELVLFDNAETPMHNLRLELEERFPKLRFHPVIGDVRIPARLDYVFGKYRPRTVFHAAAYKHVPLMEENPCEAVLVNVAGTRNVADKCIEYGADRMVMISTDKAVNPTNVMGCTKRLAEIYVQSLGLSLERGEREGRTRFVTTRFGNVLGSNGSVIPRFREQIAKGGPVTVTHPDITRFFMTIPEACRLVMEAATMTSGNQIFVFDMGESVKIAHLARRMVELAGFVPGKDIQITYTGLRPGEKLYEEVLSNKENTLPTTHDRIRIAKVREYDHESARRTVDELERLSRNVDIEGTVRLMKLTVPEFVSNNSEFQKLDNKQMKP